MINGKLASLEGYILSVSKNKDSSAVISLLTKDGIYTISAYDAFKTTSKFYQATLIFNKVIFEVTENNSNYFLKGVKTLINYTNLYSDILISCSIQMLIEITLKTHYEEDAVCYDFFEACVKGIANKFDPLTLVYIYFCQIAKINGLGPIISNCVNCSRKDHIVSFDFYEGGYLCDECAKELHYPPKDINYLKIIKYGFLVSLKDIYHAKLPTSSLKIVLFDLIKFLEDELGFKLNSYNVFKDVLK